MAVGKLIDSILSQPTVKNVMEVHLPPTSFQDSFFCIILPSCSGASHVRPPFSDMFNANQYFQYNIILYNAQQVPAGYSSRHLVVTLQSSLAGTAGSRIQA